MPENRNAQSTEEARATIIVAYQSYLIRLWKDGADALWRASIQSVQTGEVVRFANLTEVFTFLEAQTSNHQDDGTAVGNS